MKHENRCFFKINRCISSSIQYCARERIRLCRSWCLVERTRVKKTKTSNDLNDFGRVTTSVCQRRITNFIDYILLFRRTCWSVYYNYRIIFVCIYHVENNNNKKKTLMFYRRPEHHRRRFKRQQRHNSSGQRHGHRVRDVFVFC